jgi:hypothetical protein
MISIPKSEAIDFMQRFWTEETDFKNGGLTT